MRKLFSVVMSFLIILLSSDLLANEIKELKMGFENKTGFELRSDIELKTFSERKLLFERFEYRSRFDNNISLPSSFLNIFNFSSLNFSSLMNSLKSSLTYSFMNKISTCGRNGFNKSELFLKSIFSRHSNKRKENKRKQDEEMKEFKNYYKV